MKQTSGKQKSGKQKSGAFDESRFKRCMKTKHAKHSPQDSNRSSGSCSGSCSGKCSRRPDLKKSNSIANPRTSSIEVLSLSQQSKVSTPSDFKESQHLERLLTKRLRMSSALGRSIAPASTDDLYQLVPYLVEALKVVTMAGGVQLITSKQLDRPSHPQASHLKSSDSSERQKHLLSVTKQPHPALQGADTFTLPDDELMILCQLGIYPARQESWMLFFRRALSLLQRYETGALSISPQGPNTEKGLQRLQGAHDASKEMLNSFYLLWGCALLWQQVVLVYPRGFPWVLAEYVEYSTTGSDLKDRIQGVEVSLGGQDQGFCHGKELDICQKSFGDLPADGAASSRLVSARATHGALNGALSSSGHRDRLHILARAIKRLKLCSFVKRFFHSAARNEKDSPLLDKVNSNEADAFSVIHLAPKLPKYLRWLYSTEEILHHEWVHAARSHHAIDFYDEAIAYLTSSYRWRRALGAFWGGRLYRRVLMISLSINSLSAVMAGLLVPWHPLQEALFLAGMGSMLLLLGNFITFGWRYRAFARLVSILREYGALNLLLVVDGIDIDAVLSILKRLKGHGTVSSRIGSRYMLSATMIFFYLLVEEDKAVREIAEGMRLEDLKVIEGSVADHVTLYGRPAPAYQQSLSRTLGRIHA